jgi:hypothetical protein
MSPNDRVVQLYPQAPGSIFVVLYASQALGGGFLTHLHTGYYAGLKNGRLSKMFFVHTYTYAHIHKHTYTKLRRRNDEILAKLRSQYCTYKI